MFTFRLLDLSTIDGLSASYRFYRQVERQLERNYSFHQDVNELAIHLQLDPLLYEEIPNLNNSRKSDYYQVQDERIDILDSLSHNIERPHLTILDLQLLADRQVIGSIFLITTPNLRAHGLRAMYFREVTALPAYRILRSLRRVPAIITYMMPYITDVICPEYRIGVVISDPFPNITDYLINRLGFHENDNGEVIDLYLPGIGQLMSYEVFKII